MSSETSNDTPVAEQAEMPVKQDRFDNLQDAMMALGSTNTEIEEPQQDEEVEETEESEDISEEEDDGLQEDEEAEEEVTEAEEGEDEEPLEPISYDPARVITLEDGTQTTLEDLVGGNLRQADYTRKTEALAEERRAVEEIKTQASARGEEIQHTFDGLIEFLEGIIPPEPSLELLSVNQEEYLRQQAIRKSFADELSSVLSRKRDAQGQVDAMKEADLEQLRTTEAKKLVDEMPMLADPMKMTSFQESVSKTAVELGFAKEEIDAVVDHRLLRLVHLAGVGKRSLENQENARRRIKTKAQTPAAKKPAARRAPSANKKAMRALSQSGSIQDAMKIDF